MTAPDLSQKVIGYRYWTVTFPDIPADAGVLDGQGRMYRPPTPSRAPTAADDGYLASVGGAVWGRGLNEARCEGSAYGGRSFSGLSGGPHPAPHDAPGHECHCGLYACHNPGGASYWSWPTRGPWRLNQHIAFGVIAAWGRMEVHRDGFRAQFAEVLALLYSEDWFPMQCVATDSAARVYGLPKVTFERAQEFADNFGGRMPTELLPEPNTTPVAAAEDHAFTDTPAPIHVPPKKRRLFP